MKFIFRCFTLSVALLVFAGTNFAQETAPKAKEVPFATRLAATFHPSKKVVYKVVGSRELHLEIFLPAEFKATDRRVAMVAFHGGGWTGGSPPSMYPYMGWAAERGMVGIDVEYRLYKAKTSVSVFECVEDARSAFRYVRAHAAELGIDPRRIVGIGSSAGGHLVLGASLFDGVNDSSDDAAVSPRPDALILLTSVVDTSPTPEGYGSAKIGERWRELSPRHQVRTGMPPTLLFHGTADTTTPFAGAQGFQDAMLKAGNRSELVIGPDGQHGFVLKNEVEYTAAMKRVGIFLTSLNYLPATAK